MTAADKPPTMRSRVDLLVEQVGRLTDDLDFRMRPVSSSPRPYTEADALGACIAALEPLASGRSGITYPSSGTSGYASIERLLRFLAAKYNVTLIEVRTEPCARGHVDSIDGYSLAELIATAARS